MSYKIWNKQVLVIGHSNKFLNQPCPRCRKYKLEIVLMVKVINGSPSFEAEDSLIGIECDNCGEVIAGNEELEFIGRQLEFNSDKVLQRFEDHLEKNFKKDDETKIGLGWLLGGYPFLYYIGGAISGNFLPTWLYYFFYYAIAFGIGMTIEKYEASQLRRVLGLLGSAFILFIWALILESIEFVKNPVFSPTFKAFMAMLAVLAGGAVIFYNEWKEKKEKSSTSVDSKPVSRNAPSIPSHADDIVKPEGKVIENPWSWSDNTQEKSTSDTSSIGDLLDSRKSEFNQSSSCSNCNSTLKPDQKFCTSCGQKRQDS